MIVHFEQDNGPELAVVTAKQQHGYDYRVTDALTGETLSAAPARYISHAHALESAVHNTPALQDATPVGARV